MKIFVVLKWREINIVCIKESKLSCSYTHIMVINARNIFVCGTEKKECGSTQMFLFLFYRFFHYDFGSRGENENNHFWEKCVSNSNNSSAAQNLNMRFAFPMLMQWNVFMKEKSMEIIS